MILAENPFYLITGLPVHTLVVHFAVSMLPLAAMALIAIILVPRWRGAFEWAAMIGLLIGTGAAFVSKESGEALASVIGVPQNHSRWGDILPYVALLLLILAVVWVVLSRRAPKQDPVPAISIGRGAQAIVGIIAMVVSVVAIGMTVVVGHTGAAAVWASRSLDSEAKEDAKPAPTAAPTASAAASSSTGGAAATGYTMADVQKHSSASDCWSAVSGNVYDLTQWIPQHPGGSGVVEAMCGTDGTAMFDSQHQGDTTAAAALSQFLLGPLGGGAAGGAAAPASSAAAAASSAPASAAAGTYTMADVKKHSTATDCWSVVDGIVLDLTQWIPQHPGGAGVIEAMCGNDGTTLYNSQHQGSEDAAQVASQFALGRLS